MITYSVDPKLEDGTWAVDGVAQRAALSAAQLEEVIAEARGETVRRGVQGYKKVSVAPNLQAHLRKTICGLEGTMTIAQRKKALEKSAEKREARRDRRRAQRRGPIGA